VNANDGKDYLIFKLLHHLSRSRVHSHTHTHTHSPRARAGLCGYHPQQPVLLPNGCERLNCCGVTIPPGGRDVYCCFRPHLA
jgi:hypothetical protein